MFLNRSYFDQSWTLEGKENSKKNTECALLLDNESLSIFTIAKKELNLPLEQVASIMRPEETNKMAEIKT